MEIFRWLHMTVVKQEAVSLSAKHRARENSRHFKILASFCACIFSKESPRCPLALLFVGLDQRKWTPREKMIFPLTHLAHSYKLGSRILSIFSSSTTIIFSVISVFQWWEHVTCHGANCLISCTVYVRCHAIGVTRHSRVIEGPPAGLT